ncbi:MAG: Ig-like domain-containing protein [Halobacteriovoraceae bacterium]|nr:Ig-like domain-containing protein [Halobacteriovoraceae bacterium]MCB9094123.1 Ig-like domain-containing protein [Halobacteriovoraceae bacterium]
MIKFIFSFLILISLSNCSFKATDSSTTSKGFGQTISAKDVVKVEEDGKTTFNLVDVYDYEDFYKQFELVETKSFNAEVTFGEKDIVYKPHPDFFGLDQLQIVVINKLNGDIVDTTVNIEVTEKEDIPSAYDDHFVYDDKESEQIFDVLSNDIDVDGDKITLKSVASLEKATIQIVSNKLKIIFDNDFTMQATDVVNVDYTIRDSNGNENSARLVLGGSAEVLTSDEDEIPVRVVFISSSDKKLTEKANEDAEEAVKILNNRSKKETQEHIKFKLAEVKEVEDDLFYNFCDPTKDNCVDYDRVANKYGESGKISLVFVNTISGAVAGISKVHRLPFSKEATVVSEYRGLVKNNTYVTEGTIFSHEIGHLVGMFHTQQIGAEENAWVSYSRCGQDLNYFQRANEIVEEPFKDDDGVFWDDFHNIMRSVVGKPSDDHGFFTSGYDPVFSKVLSCYRKRAI